VADSRIEQIMDQLVTQFRSIDRAGGYFNDTLLDQVGLGWMDFADAPGDRYPCIRLYEYDLGPSRWLDQQNHEDPWSVRVVAYAHVEEGGEDDLFTALLRLQSDLEAAVYSDGSLAGLVYEISTHFEGTQLNDTYAGILFEITGLTVIAV
jgi:hypothetical protein